MGWYKSIHMEFTAFRNGARDAFLKLIEGNTFGHSSSDKMTVDNVFCDRKVRIYMTRDGRDYVLEMGYDSPAPKVDRRDGSEVESYSLTIVSTDRKTVKTEEDRAEEIIKQNSITARF